MTVVVVERLRQSPFRLENRSERSGGSPRPLRRRHLIHSSGPMSSGLYTHKLAQDTNSVTVGALLVSRPAFLSRK